MKYIYDWSDIKTRFHHVKYMASLYHYNIDLHIGVESWYIMSAWWRIFKLAT